MLTRHTVDSTKVREELESEHVWGIRALKRSCMYREIYSVMDIP